MSDDLYNDAIPSLMGDLLPSGVLGIAITGLFASFMAGVAANVSSLNTVVTYDLLEPYLQKDRSDRHYLNAGRVVTVVGIVGAIALGRRSAVAPRRRNFLISYSIWSSKRRKRA